LAYTIKVNLDQPTLPLLHQSGRINVLHNSMPDIKDQTELFWTKPLKS